MGLVNLHSLVLRHDFAGKQQVVKLVTLATGIALSVSGSIVHAEDSVGALTDDATSSSSSIATTPSSSLDSQQANEALKEIKGNFPKPSTNDALKQISDATESGRAESFGLAHQIAQPIIWLFMLLTNIIWFIMTALFFFSTAIDILSIVFSGFRTMIARSDRENNQQAMNGNASAGGNPVLNFVKSFFALSMDAEQIIMQAGLNSETAGTGGVNPNSPTGYPTNGSPAYGNPMSNIGVGNQGNQGSKQSRPHTGNMLMAYVVKRFWTFVFLGVSFVIFGTSLASGLQQSAVAILFSIGQGIINIITGWINSI